MRDPQEKERSPSAEDPKPAPSLQPGSEAPKIPTISLPKGGGALRSVDEKFSVNPANGTCEFRIPLPLSKTRTGLDSSLALTYNSGTGNGPFGLGWNLTLPSIQRRTDNSFRVMRMRARAMSSCFPVPKT